MDDIEQVHRGGLDIQTAFDARARVTTAGGSAGGSAGRGLVGRALQRVVGRIRRGLGGLGRGTYRLMRPILWPLAHTGRGFLLGSLESEMRQNRARLEEISATVDAVARRVAIPSGPGEVLVRTSVGYVLCGAADHLVLASLLDGGELERGTRLMIQKLLRPGDTFVDVGAHIGMHTLAAGRAMERRGRIHAFEPFGPTAKLLYESILLNGLTEIVQVHVAAASDRAGVMPLYLGPVSGHHSLYPLDVPQGFDPISVEVPLVRLDDALAEVDRVDLMKIDVEGAELEVLAGAASIVAANPEIALIVEFGPSHLRRAGSTADDWLRHFHELGLVYREIDPDNGRLRVRAPESLASVESANLLFARPQARAWNRAAGG